MLPNSTQLRLKLQTKRGAIYELFRRDKVISEPHEFCNNFEDHDEFPMVQNVLLRLEQDTRLQILPNGRLRAQRFKKEFFRDESSSTLPHLLAIPGSDTDTGLRQLCFVYPQWRTVVLLNGFDKQGYEGSWEFDDRLRGLVLTNVEIHLAIEACLVLDYYFDEAGLGFFSADTRELADIVDLEDYLQ